MAYRQDNRLGWTRPAFDTFFDLTKPGSSWTFVKKNYKDPSKKSEVSHCINQLYSLFRSTAPYKPLSDLFTKLDFSFNRILDFHQTAHHEQYAFGQAKQEKLKEFESLLIRIQPRLERLWNFARQESLVPASSSYEIANKHAVQLIANMRSMLIKKYKDTGLVTNMMKVFAREIKQDLREGNESHGDYNEIDITYDAWEARYIDFTPDSRELMTYKRGRG